MAKRERKKRVPPDPAKLPPPIEFPNREPGEVTQEQIDAFLKEAAWSKLDRKPKEKT